MLKNIKKYFAREIISVNFTPKTLSVKTTLKKNAGQTPGIPT